jgi:hypothetical protein
MPAPNAILFSGFLFILLVRVCLYTHQN